MIQAPRKLAGGFFVTLAAMPWPTVCTPEFVDWWESLDEDERASVDTAVTVLETFGPNLGRPRVDTLYDSRHANMKELRLSHDGRPIRVFFAFDPTRSAALLIGGDKSGEKRFYKRLLPVADAIYDRHLTRLAESAKENPE